MTEAIASENAHARSGMQSSHDFHGHFLTPALHAAIQAHAGDMSAGIAAGRNASECGSSFTVCID